MAGADSHASVLGTADHGPFDQTPCTGATCNAMGGGSLPNLSAPFDDELVCRQFAQSAGASGVKLVSADTDLRSQAQFAPVIESGAGIDHDSRGVYLVAESAGGIQIARDDCVGVMRAVLVDMFNRRINVGHHFRGENQ